MWRNFSHNNRRELDSRSRRCGMENSALVGAGELDAFTSDSISLADSAKLTTAAGFVWGVVTEVRASIKSIQVASGTFIIYKDCPQS